MGMGAEIQLLEPPPPCGSMGGHGSVFLGPGPGFWNWPAPPPVVLWFVALALALGPGPCPLLKVLVKAFQKLLKGL